MTTSALGRFIFGGITIDPATPPKRIFSPKAVAVLTDEGVCSLGQLLLITPRELRELPLSELSFRGIQRQLNRRGLQLFNPREVGDAREALIYVFGSPRNIPIDFVLKHGVPLHWIPDIRQQGVKTLGDIACTGGWQQFLREQGIINPTVRDLLIGLFLMFANDLSA